MTRDSLAAHLKLCAELDWECPPEELNPRLAALVRVGFLETGAQERYLAEVDLRRQPIDFARGVRFRQALAYTRSLVPEPLTYPALQAIQQRVLGLEGPAPFRKGPAFAHGGSVAYAWLPELEARFAKKLVADAQSGVHPCVRAVQLYLDVIHVHPFADGNARLARLTLEHSLRSAGWPTPDLLPFVALEKPAGDPRRVWQLVRLLANGVLKAGGICQVSLERD